MAIVVEEERSRVNIGRLAAWIVIFGIIGASIYYVFFSAPDLVVISPPSGFQNITPLAQITAHPEDVLNSATFRSLQAPSFPLPDPQGPAAVGRTNPFMAP